MALGVPHPCARYVGAAPPARTYCELETDVVVISCSRQQLQKLAAISFLWRSFEYVSIGSLEVAGIHVQWVRSSCV